MFRVSSVSGPRCLPASAKQLFCFVFYCLALTATRPAAAERVYWITDLGTLGGTYSAADNINASGQVVGSSTTANGDLHAFLWSAGVITDLGTLGGSNSEALDINNQGQVVGYAETAGGNLRAFLWDSTHGMTDLGTLGGNNSQAYGINAAGQIVGAAETAGGDIHAILWSGGTKTDLGALGGTSSQAFGINVFGQVIGYAETAGGDLRAFLWDSAGGMTDIGTLGGDNSQAFGINTSAQVVGYGETAGTDIHAFLWDDVQGMTDLGTLGGSSSQAFGINASGQVVGYAAIANGDLHPFLWQNDLLTDVNDLLPADSGWVLFGAAAINDRGQIVGYGEHNGQTHTFLLTPIEGILPDHGGNRGPVSVRIVTANLQQGATVQLTAPGQPDIDGDKDHTTVLYDPDFGTTVLHTTFDLNGATPGARSVVITQPDTTIITVPNGFTIEEGGKAYLQVDIIGKEKARLGTEATFQVVISNRGNLDAVGVPVWLAGLPTDTTVHWDFALDPPLPVSSGSELMSPVVIPRLAPDTAVSLQYRLTFNTAGTVSLKVWTNPFFRMLSRTGADPRLLDCFKEVIKEVYVKASGVTPDGSCVSSAASGLINQLTALINQAYLNENDNGTLTSLTSQVEQAVLSTAQCMSATLDAGKILAGEGVVFSQLDASTLLRQCFSKETPASKDVIVGSSEDPNDKGGPVSLWLSDVQPFAYTIYFENDPTAQFPAYNPTAQFPAYKVIVQDQLDLANLDLTSISLGAITLEGHPAQANAIKKSIPSPGVSPIAGLREYNADVDLRPDKNLIVHINSNVNLDNGILAWTLTCTHPDGTPPNYDEGFLDQGAHGSVSFSVLARPSLTSGMAIHNYGAAITFDVNNPLTTRDWTNTLDSEPPTSHVLPLAPTRTTPSFVVQWKGTDTGVGSGLRDYTIYVSDNDGPFRPWLENVTQIGAQFPGVVGHKYAFYSVARDNVDHIEPIPDQPDATTIVLLAPISLTLTPNAVAGCNNSTGKVTLNAPAPSGGVVVTLTNTNPAASVPASVTIPAGATYKSFTITTTPVSSITTGNITATYNGVSLSKKFSVWPIGPQSVTLTPNPVVGGTSVTGTVTLVCPAALGDIVVLLKTKNPSVAKPTVGSITIPRGSSSGTFTVSTSHVSVVSYATIEAWVQVAPNTYSIKGKKLTVNP